MSDQGGTAGVERHATTPASTKSVDQAKFPSMTISAITASTTISQRRNVRRNLRIDLVQPLLNSSNRFGDLNNRPLRLLLALRAITKQFAQTLDKIVTNRSFHTPSPFCRSQKTTAVQR